MYDFSALTSDEAVTTVRLALKKKLARLGKAGLLLPLALVVGVAVGVVAAPRQLGFGVCFITVLTVAWTSLRLDEKLEALRQTLHSLTPLSKTLDCEAVLALCQRSEEAQSVRERALAAGRQLYRFDFEEMLAKAKRETETQTRARQASAQEAACKALHGFSA